MHTQPGNSSKQPEIDPRLSALLAVTSEEALEKLRNACGELCLGCDLEVSAVRSAYGTVMENTTGPAMGALRQAALMLVDTIAKQCEGSVNDTCREAFKNYKSAIEPAQSTLGNRMHLSSLTPDEQHQYWRAWLSLKDMRRAYDDIKDMHMSLHSSICIFRLALISFDRAPALVRPAMTSFCNAARVLRSAVVNYRDESFAIYADISRAAQKLSEIAERAAEKQAESLSSSGCSYDDDDSDYDESPTSSMYYFDLDDEFDDWQPMTFNPATGLPMIQNTCVDISGHAIGTGQIGGRWD